MRSLLLALLLMLFCLPGLTASEASLESRLYNLKDLLSSEPDFPALPHGLHVKGAGAGQQGEVSNSSTGADSTKSLAAFVHQHFDPAVLDAIGPRSQVLSGGTWRVQAEPDLHRHIEGRLAAMRAREAAQVKASFHFLEMEVAHWNRSYAKEAPAWRQLDEAPGLAVINLPLHSNGDLASRLVEDEAVTAIKDGDLTSFLGQTASANWIKQIPVHSVLGQEDGSFSAGELIANAGQSLTMTAFRLDDADDLLRLDLVISNSSLRELRTDKVALLQDQPALAIDTPDLSQHSMRLRGLCGPTRALLVYTGMRYPEQGEPRLGLLLVTAHLLELDAKQAASPQADPPRSAGQP